MKMLLALFPSKKKTSVVMGVLKENGMLDQILNLTRDEWFHSGRRINPNSVSAVFSGNYIVYEDDVREMLNEFLAELRKFSYADQFEFWMGVYKEYFNKHADSILFVTRIMIARGEVIAITAFLHAQLNGTINLTSKSMVYKRVVDRTPSAPVTSAGRVFLFPNHVSNHALEIDDTIIDLCMDWRRANPHNPVSDLIWIGLFGNRVFSRTYPSIRYILNAGPTNIYSTRRDRKIKIKLLALHLKHLDSKGMREWILGNTSIHTQETAYEPDTYRFVEGVLMKWISITNIDRASGRKLIDLFESNHAIVKTHYDQLSDKFNYKRATLA